VHFGVHYHPSHVWKVLRRLGWGCQVLARLAIQRDEQASTHWKRYRWPAIKKARRLGAHFAFLDESGLLLIPPRRQTWASEGYTPIVPYGYRHDRISALAALTVSPKRQHLGSYIRFQPRHFQALDIAFLWALLQHLRGSVVLLWDRGAMPRGPAIEAIC